MSTATANQKFWSESLRAFVQSCKNWTSYFSRYNLILFLASVLLARASMFRMFHPFALAAVAAINFVYPRGLFLTLIGVSMGLALSLPFWEFWAYEFLVFLVLYGAWQGKKQGGSTSYQLVFGSFFTTAAVLIGRIILATIMGEEPIFLYFALLEAIMVGLFVVVFAQFGLKIKGLASTNKQLSSEVIAMIFLVCGAAIAGLDGIFLSFLPIQDLVLRVGVVLAAWVAGPGAGAVVGIAGGMIVVLLSSFSPYYLVGLATAGICAGLFRDMGKWGVIFGSFAGAALLSYQLLTPGEMLAMASSVIGAAICIAVFPSELILQARNWFVDCKTLTAKISTEEQRVRESVAVRLDTFSNILFELAHSFAQLPQEEVINKSSDISKMIDAISDRVCTGCLRYQICWKEQFFNTFNNFGEALVKAENSGALQATHLPPGLRASCSQTHKLVQAVNYILELHRVETVWEQKLVSSREVVSGQLQGVGELLASLSQEMQERRNVKADPAKALQTALTKKIPVREVRTILRSDNQYEVRVLCLHCDGREACKSITPVVATVLETHFSLTKLSCGYYRGEHLCELALVPEKAYHLDYRIVETARQGSSVSGDNHLVMPLPAGKIGIALSDGMGSGSRAALESSTTISLMEQLLRAGMDRRFAIRAINSLLLFRSPEENFATLDLFLFDEYTGEAEFVKIASQPTYILRGSEIIKIESKSLPIGILDQIDASVETVELYPNDYLIMSTDGVKDCVPNLSADWLERVLIQAPRKGASELAEYLLQQVLTICNGEPDDDLTISVAKVRDKSYGSDIPVYMRKRVGKA